MLRCSCSVGALNFILKFWKTIKVEGLKILLAGIRSGIFGLRQEMGFGIAAAG